MIKAISFDLDDTLWPVAPVLRHAEERLYAYLCERHPKLTARFDPDSLRSLGMRVFEESPELARDVTAARKAVLRRAALESGEDEALVEPAFEVFLHARNQVHFYPEVLEVITGLYGQYSLGALSNGNAEVERTGLKPYFGFAFSSGNSTVLKPRPEAFLPVLQATGVERGELLHVGDDPETDISGAVAAGIPNVWVNRDGRPWPEERFPRIRPDHEIATLRELPALLGA